MKKLYPTCLAVFVAGLATCALADGPTPGTEDPRVAAPRDAWTGPYVALAYGRTTRTEERVECSKLGQPKACDDPIFDYYPEYKEETRYAVETSTDRAGAVAGYRWDLGAPVVGAELALYDGDVSPALVLGLDAGTLLPHVHLDRDGASLGVEARLSTRLSAGVRAGDGGATLTFGWGF